MARLKACLECVCVRVSGVSGSQEARRGKRRDSQVTEGEECGDETSARHREGGEQVVSSRFGGVAVGEGRGYRGPSRGSARHGLSTLCFGGSRRE